MPSPLGHTVIGFATHSLYSRKGSSLSTRKLFVFVIFLANVADADVLVGLIICGNGNVLHRGPTHSLLFCLLMALLSSNAWRCWPIIPRVNFLWCFLILLSHILADAVFTSASVSFWWPLEEKRISGHWGWDDVLNLVFLGSFRDKVIVFGFGTLALIARFFRYGTIPLLHRRPGNIKSASTSKHG